MPSASSAEVVEAALGLGSFAGTVKERRRPAFETASAFSVWFTRFAMQDVYIHKRKLSIATLLFQIHYTCPRTTSLDESATTCRYRLTTLPCQIL